MRLSWVTGLLAAPLSLGAARPTLLNDVGEPPSNVPSPPQGRAGRALRAPLFVAEQKLAVAAQTPWQASALKKPAIERDWQAFPAIVNDTAPFESLWALGDVHGDYRRALTLLQANGLLACETAEVAHDALCPPAHALWTGGDAVLVQLGDVIDKGAGSVDMLRLLRHLEQKAPAQQGRVHALLGNHEAAFLAKPLNAKSLGPGGIVFDLWQRGIDPEEYATDKEPDGAWLRRRPFGARVGPLFFAHAGQTSSRSLEGLDAYLRQGVKRDGFDSPVLSGENSILRARDFAGHDGEQGPELARLLGVRHIVFAHDPDISPKPGRIYPFGATDGTFSLFAIDTGLTQLLDYSHGWLLHVTQRKDDQLRIEACDHRGRCEDLANDRAL